MTLIRQAVASDWPSIRRLVEKTYGGDAQFKDEVRWAWQLAEAPYDAASLDKPPSWIALEDGEVIGQMSMQPTRVFLSCEPIDKGWYIDLMISPRHRGKGLGHKLYGAILDDGYTAITLTMAPATRVIAERAGCVTLPRVEQLLRVQSLSHATISRVIHNSVEHGGRGRQIVGLVDSLPGAIAAKCISAGAKLSRSFAVRPGRSASIRKVDQCNAQDIDRIFAAMRSAIPGMFDRSSEFWQWRFHQAPRLQYHFAQFEADGIVKGIVVWREPDAQELPVGTIVEILADPQDVQVIVDLTAYAVNAMAKFEAIVAGASHPVFAKALRRLGFIRVKSHFPTVSSPDPSIMKRFAETTGPWHMSKADHDWDQIHAGEPHQGWVMGCPGRDGRVIALFRGQARAAP